MLAVKFYCGVGFHFAILQLLADFTQDESDSDPQGRVDNVEVFRNWIRSGENRSSRKTWANQGLLSFAAASLTGC
jgi:hypothetical protein